MTKPKNPHALIKAYLSAIGRKGGKSRSPAKIRAAKQNGRMRKKVLAKPLGLR